MNAINPYSTPKMMNPEEARTAADAIKRGMNNLRAQLLVFCEREGWKALNYSSWLECVKTEFGQSKAYLYRQLEAAQIEQRITGDELLANGPKMEGAEIIEGEEKSPMGDSENPPEEAPENPPPAFDDPEILSKIGTIPERQLRPLTALPPEEQKPAFDLAKETAPEGHLTAAHVEKVVKELKGEKVRRTPPPPPPPPPVRTIIEGVRIPENDRREPEYWSLSAIDCIQRIEDDHPGAKEALKRIAVHVWNRQHKGGDV